MLTKCEIQGLRSKGMPMTTRRTSSVVATAIAAVVLSVASWVIVPTRAASQPKAEDSPAVQTATPSPEPVAESPVPVDTPAPDAGGAAPDPLPARDPALVADAVLQSPEAVTWTLDLYDRRAERWQDPDPTACTAAAVESMLNTIAYAHSDADLIWQPTTSYSKQEAILAYERANMTMLRGSAGTDLHGWRNALNFYGWGAIDAGVYRDSAYSSFGDAAKAAVSALAVYRKPVGIPGMGGSHAQFITGYKVVGADPATGSTDFTIVGVYLTDPWHAAHYRDTWVTYSRWQWGWNWLRFAPYSQGDSPYRYPLDGNIGRSEWYGKWVILDPMR